MYFLQREYLLYHRKMANINRFSDLMKKQDKEEEKKSQELFAGGLDQRGGGSGLSVLGPPSSSSASGGASIFDSVVQRAQQNEANGAVPPSSASSGGGNQRVIHMYRNGFIVDDGPFRDLTAPEHQAFIRSLGQGMVPAELSQGHPGDLDVALDDKRGEDYVPPPPPAYVAFSSGTALGSSSSSSEAWVANADILSTVSENDWKLDESQPNSTLQVRTLDGKRLKIRLNNSATVLHLAAAIRSQGVTEAFILNAGYPPKDVNDPTHSLTTAGLVGAAVTLKKA